MHPVPPSLALPGLYERVALSPFFPDNKAWADAVPLRAPEDILRDYHAQPPAGDAALKRFVDANFAIPDPMGGAQPEPGLPLAAHIDALWPLLTRQTVTAEPHSSLLPLPRPYIVPGGRFTEVYYWDSYFTMLGFGPDQAQRKHDMVADFADLIERYGHIPNGSRSYYLSRSQPPFFFKMVELLRPEDPGQAFAEYLPALQSEYAYWMAGADRARVSEPVDRVVHMPGGALLNRYWDAYDTPRDESWREDVETAQASGRAPDRVYRDLRAGAESGWDFSSRWLADGQSLATIRTTEIVPADLNSILYGLERAIAQGCAAQHDSAGAKAFDAKADARRDAIRTHLWNAGTGTFDDWLWTERRPAGNISAAALYPLFFGVATQEQAQAAAHVAERELLKPGGLATTNRTTAQQWDSPNGWAPLHWIAVRGLRDYGEHRLADEIARRWLDTVTTVYAATGKLLEKYDVVSSQPGGGGEYPLQDGFGWTNGVTMQLLRTVPESRS